jgi:hypothetical protein
MSRVERLHAHPESSCALLECGFATFQNLANLASDQRIFQSAALIGDLRQLACSMRPARRDDYLVSIGVDDQVLRSSAN